MNKFLNKTDFSRYQVVILDGVGKAQKPPKWNVYNNGREIVQTVNGYVLVLRMPFNKKLINFSKLILCLVIPVFVLCRCLIFLSVIISSSLIDLSLRIVHILSYIPY